MKRNVVARCARSTLFCLACLYPSAASAQGQVPGYIRDLPPYAVRALSGQYAPTNRQISIRDVTPSEWLTSDPGGGLGSIIGAWSGGFKAVSGTKMYVHGGGHADSANNGLYVFDFAGDAQPTGWTLPSISHVSAVIENGTAYADGKPNSVHTYDGAVYAHHNNTVYRFSGSRYRDGGFCNAGAKYNLTTNVWTLLEPHPASFNHPGILYDPVTGKILVDVTQTVWEVAFFHTSDDTWSAAISVSPYWIGGDSCSAWDPGRGRGILLGEDGGRLVTVNWTEETVTSAPLPASGATIIVNTRAASCFYDPSLDRYWVFGGAWDKEEYDIPDSPGWTNLYEINASTFAITAHRLSGDPILPQEQLGTYGRFVFLDAWRAIGTVADVDGPAYVIRLPGTGQPGDSMPPSPPVNLRVQ